LQSSKVFDNIRAECARKRITIAELSERLGIERRTFYNWEKKGDISVIMLEKTAAALDVPIDRLMG